jgi:hydroxyacylglutathione hydrolase
MKGNASLKSRDTLTKAFPTMAALQIHQFPCRSDNFGVLIHDQASGVTASIDAPEAAAVRRALKEKGWRLTHIFTTHHHADHTDGNLELKSETGCTIIGPRGESAKIPGIDSDFAGGETLSFGGFKAKVLDTPGHTLGHISLWFEEARVAFVGDTLFSLGCGRVIEGTPQMMWASLSKLMALPAETSFHCGHEYTEANARFALTIEPGNAALRARAAEVTALRAAGKPSLPASIGAELAANPFLRPSSPEIRKRLGMEDKADWQVFAEIRERKNKS